MRLLPVFSLGALLILVAGCDTIVDPPVIDDPPVPLMPLDEGNYWVLDRMSPSGQQNVDTLNVAATFTHAGETWVQIAGSSSLAQAWAGGNFVVRDDGYYFSHADPRESDADIHLRYAYPAEVGTEYIIEPREALITGQASTGAGRTTVTVIATNEPVQTPFGQGEAYRYRFTVETFFLAGEEIPVIDTSYDRLVVPGLGYTELELVFLMQDPETGNLFGLPPTVWTLADAHIQR